MKRRLRPLPALRSRLEAVQRLLGGKGGKLPDRAALLAREAELKRCIERREQK